MGEGHLVDENVEVPGGVEDTTRLLLPLLKQGWALKNTGKFTPVSITMAVDLPWVYSNVEFDCTVWNAIFHNTVAQKRMVHSHCHNCIKIVAKPKTLRDLVKIETIQRSMLFPCKCGIDRRPHTHALYGAYWYNRGFEEAKFRYEILKERFEEDEISHIPLIIKKACTEFEMAMGPTDQWKPPTQEQLALEKRVEALLDWRPTPPTLIPDHIVTHTHHLWVAWAYQHGDETYKDFTNGEPLYPELVTYHEET
jgi:hypothetical protein